MEKSLKKMEQLEKKMEGVEGHVVAQLAKGPNMAFVPVQAPAATTTTPLPDRVEILELEPIEGMHAGVVSGGV